MKRLVFSPWQGGPQRSKGRGQLSMPMLFFPSLPFSQVTLTDTKCMTRDKTRNKQSLNSLPRRRHLEWGRKFPHKFPRAPLTWGKSNDHDGSTSGTPHPSPGFLLPPHLFTLSSPFPHPSQVSPKLCSLVFIHMQPLGELS